MIRWSLSDGIYELALAREPCNEIGTTVLAELERFLAEIDVENASALVIHSEIRGGFCAGADLRELYRGILDTPEQQRKPRLRNFIERIHAVMNRLDTLPLTTVGVVHGVCFGGGLELALTCDILIAEKTARFAFPELRLGLVPGFGGIPRLNRDVPNSLVRDMLLSGRSINAKRAQQAGLVSQMVAVGQGLDVARRTAAQAAKFDPLARSEAKKFLKPLPTEALEREKDLFVRLADRPVLQAALKRFVESQDPLPYLP